MNPDIRIQDDLFGHVNGTWLDTAEIPERPLLVGPVRDARRRRRGARPRDHRGLRRRVAGGIHRRERRRGTQDRRPVRQLHGRGARRAARPHPDPAAAASRSTPSPTSPSSAPSSASSSAAAAAACSAPTSTPTTATPTATSSTWSRAASACPTRATTARRSSPRSARSTSPTSSRILTLAERPDPDGTAARVLALETRLAKGHWERAETRDVIKTYNLTTLDELKATAAQLRLRRLGHRARRRATRRSPRPWSGSRRTSPTWRRCSPTPRSRTGRRSSPSARSAPPRRTSPARSSRPTSTSTAAPSPAPPSCAPAGSAASGWSRVRSARPSAASTSPGTSRRGPRR